MNMGARNERCKQRHIEHFMLLFNGFEQLNEFIGHFPFRLLSLGLVIVNESRTRERTDVYRTLYQYLRPLVKYSFQTVFARARCKWVRM